MLYDGRGAIWFGMPYWRANALTLALATLCVVAFKLRIGVIDHNRCICKEFIWNSQARKTGRIWTGFENRCIFRWWHAKFDLRGGNHDASVGAVITSIA